MNINKFILNNSSSFTKSVYLNSYIGLSGTVGYCTAVQRMLMNLFMYVYED